MELRSVAYTIIMCILGLFGGINTMNTSEVAIIQGSNAQVVEKSEKEAAQETKTTENNDLININTASATELDKLYKIGPKMAQRIINYREEQGPFKKKEEIMNVKGIGKKTYENIKDNIKIN